MSSKPLSDLSVPQIDLILAKLHLKAPSRYDADERLELLQCSAIFRRHLSGYDNGTILAKFKNGNFIDFETSDEVVKGIFPHAAGKNILQYPCVICAGEVTDNRDKSGFGLHCSGCESYFHNSCNDHPINVKLYDALKDSPSYVRTFCSNCNNAMNDVASKLKRIDRKVSSVSTKVEECSDKVSNLKSFSSVVGGVKPQMNKATNQLVKQLSAQNKAVKVEETEERNKRTLLVRKPTDVDIRDSKGIRKAFNKEYPGVIIRNCRVTAGGSFKIELDDPDEAKAVTSDWKDDLFGGNEGVVSPDALHTSGIVKHVYLDAPEDEIKTSIMDKYPVSNVEFFKRNGNFTGTMKVTFNTRKDLMDVISDRIKVFEQRYLLEEFKPMPRVIKCNRCQVFGHIARRCRSETSLCGKCGTKGHESDKCLSTLKKCVHCKKDGHITGDKSCEVMKQKLDEIKQRSQYGF